MVKVTKFIVIEIVKKDKHYFVATSTSRESAIFRIASKLQTKLNVKQHTY